MSGGIGLNQDKLLQIAKDIRDAADILDGDHPDGSDVDFSEEARGTLADLQPYCQLSARELVGGNEVPTSGNSWQVEVQWGNDNSEWPTGVEFVQAVKHAYANFFEGDGSVPAAYPSLIAKARLVAAAIERSAGGYANVEETPGTWV